MISNEDRADMAQSALDAFYDHAYTICGESQRTAFGDLLMDMRHLADRLGLDWTRLIDGTASGYRDETEESPAAARRPQDDADDTHYADLPR